MFGSIYLRARYYTPRLGRFTAPDPLALAGLELPGTSPYAYGWDNPLSYFDPSGLHGDTTSSSDDVWVTASLGSGMTSEQIKQAFWSTMDWAERMTTGLRAHNAIEEYVKQLYPSAQIEVQNPAGRADIVLTNPITGKKEVYEIKPLTNSPVGVQDWNQRAKNQLNGYVAALNNAVPGTMWNPDGLTLTLSPTGSITLHTFPSDPGMIYYSLDQTTEPSLVPVPLPDLSKYLILIPFLLWELIPEPLSP